MNWKNRITRTWPIGRWLFRLMGIKLQQEPLLQLLHRWAPHMHPQKQTACSEMLAQAATGLTASSALTADSILNSISGRVSLLHNEGR